MNIFEASAKSPLSADKKRVESLIKRGKELLKTAYEYLKERRGYLGSHEKFRSAVKPLYDYDHNWKVYQKLPWNWTRAYYWALREGLGEEGLEYCGWAGLHNTGNFYLGLLYEKGYIPNVPVEEKVKRIISTAIGLRKLADMVRNITTDEAESESYWDKLIAVVEDYIKNVNEEVVNQFFEKPKKIEKPVKYVKVAGEMPKEYKQFKPEIKKAGFPLTPIIAVIIIGVILYLLFKK